ncbi:MAG: copper chaperone PCu(A)C [Parvularculaceae bacterium]
MNRIFPVITAAATFTLTACGAPKPQSEAACEAAQDATIAVTDARVRPAAGRPVTAAYFVLCNAGGTDDALIGVESGIADTLEIHESHMNEAGVASMTRLEELQLPAGEPVRLEPGGAHVMIIGLSSDIDEGARVRLTLRFRNAEPIEIEAEARP